MILVQISDTHVSVDLPAGARRLADLERTIAEINAMDPQPDAVIHTGDLANRGKPAEYAAAAAVLRALRAPFFPVPGNRDDRRLLGETFVPWPRLDDDAAFVQYAVEDHAVRLLGLDSQSTGSQKGDYCEARAASLARALAAQPHRPTAVFVHHPPFELEGVVDWDPFQYESRDGAGRLVAALAGAGNVVRVFCGHAHRDRRADLDGIPASTIPSLAVDLRQGDDPQRPSGAPRFQVHRYRGRGGFETRTVEVGTPHAPPEVAQADADLAAAPARGPVADAAG